MFTDKELDFLKGKDLSKFAPGYSISFGQYFFKAFGVNEDNRIIENQLDSKTFELDGFAQYLYMDEWQELESILLSNLPENCGFSVEGIIERREDGTGSLGIISLFAK